LADWVVSGLFFGFGSNPGGYFALYVVAGLGARFLFIFSLTAKFGGCLLKYLIERLRTALEYLNVARLAITVDSM
jgi:hypothetical protein